MPGKKLSKKSPKLSILNIIIQVIVFVGNTPFLISSLINKSLEKSTRFIVATIIDACKWLQIKVFKRKILKRFSTAFGHLSKSFGRVRKKVMSNKYALKTKIVAKKKIIGRLGSLLPCLGGVARMILGKGERILTFARMTLSNILRAKSRNVTLSSVPTIKKYARKKYHAYKTQTHTKVKEAFGKFKLFVGGSLFSIVFLVVPALGYSWYRGLPQPGLLVENAQTHKPTRILDRKGQPLYEIYVDKKYAPVVLSQIPKNVILATLAVEDHEFFNHKGVRPLSIIRAAKATIVDDSMQGGSTITQQLIKNVLLSPERTVTRKLKEVFLAFAVEKKYTKDEILELYLNNIPYGGTAWGIQSASQKFFGKNVEDLTLSEAAFLAGLPSSPSSYVSYANDIDTAKERQRLVLNRMEELKIITTEQNTEAITSELKFVPQVEYIKAPHFVEYVRKELEKRYGKSMVESGGLTVRTSLDLDLQNRLQDIVTSEVAYAASLNISNGALVVLDPKSGEILAYVGSIDYFKEGWGAYDVITAARQPGSTIKVVTYALALESGYSPATTITDGPLTIQLGGGRTYTPVNYDGKFHGKVSLRSALANSYNIPAVKLVKDLGPDNMVTLANKMGLRDWQVDDSYGYAVTLGGKETRLLDLSNVFATLAREGIYKPVTPFISVRDANGFEIYADGRSASQRAISPESAYIMTNILSDNYARIPAFGSQSSLYIPGRTVAVKTGTTNDKRDNYSVGYTPSFVVGVWVGNNDNTPMNPYLASGVSGAAPIWNRAMRVVLEGQANEQFSVPEGVFVKIDSKCGRSEVFTKGSKVPDLCPEKEKDKDKKKEKSD